MDNEPRYLQEFKFIGESKKLLNKNNRIEVNLQ